MKRVITTDSAKPFITQKDVILCRSGIQIYTYDEVVKALGEPPVKKDFYKEYRPANVVVKAQDLCVSLPVTKEHPNEFVTENNWKELAGGVLDRSISVVALDEESDGEIGLKSNITFFTRELYDYYLDNKEVSLGYTCDKHFVDNPEEVGYDILLDEILEVNHLAITRAGRGGSSVAVIDTVIGGIRKMRTGIFSYIASKLQNDSKEKLSFGQEVLKAIKDSKGTTEQELASEMKCVLDSMSILKDCEAKSTLVEVVKDCFDNKDKSLANEEELTKVLDSMWVDIHSDSLKEIAKAFEKLAGKKEEPNVTDTTKTEVVDSDKEDKEDKKEESKENKKEDKKEDSKEESKEESKEDKKETKDSAVMTKDDILSVIKDTLPALVQKSVKEVLGIKDDTSKKQVDGGVIDTGMETKLADYNYEDFI